LPEAEGRMRSAAPAVPAVSPTVRGPKPWNQSARGIDVTTTMTILSEAGWEMSKCKTKHRFVSWLRLCPGNRISGDKIIGKGGWPVALRLWLQSWLDWSIAGCASAAIHRPRSGVLRRPAGQTANQLFQAQSRQSLVSNHRSFVRVVSGEMSVNNSCQHPACYTHSEIPVGGVVCEFIFCGFWRFCWRVWRLFLAGHRIE
jgi:hypothetical protein